MHEDFVKRANIKRNDYLLKTEALFIANKSAWLADFEKHFQTVCSGIQKIQNESAISAISYLEYTMLYTNFVNRQYIAEVCVYGDDSYLDKNQRIVDEYDISFLLVYFDKLWDDLIDLKRRYVGKVSAQDVTAFMLRTLPDFYSYLINIARFAIAECVDKKPFVDIEKNIIFMVNVGDYMSKTETVFIENKDKNAGALIKWFGERLKKEYTFGDYSCLDFSTHYFLGIDFRYAHFRGATLCFTSFNGSSLVGTSFRGANMEGCSLAHCSINEADFTGAILKNASFENAEANVGLINEDEWQFVGYLPAIFRSADLTNANFTGANLKGADFTGAVLTGVNFTGAILDGAIFSMDNIPLTDVQRSKIIVIKE